jgi:rsbT co-antagonist protein RsbR
MAHQEEREKLQFGEEELRSRRAYYELTDEDLRRLAGLRWFADKYTAEIVDAFYELLLAHPESRAFLPDDATVRRVKETQRRYFLQLFTGICDRAYAEERLRVGVAHERIGMPPKLYLGAYARYLRLIHERLRRELSDPAALAAAFTSLQKLVAFDMSLAVDAYIAANRAAVDRQQAAIRELSTPVIQVHERVLLLPLIGAIDSPRAEQIIEAVLSRVIEERAKVIILDIAGVSVVDTKVAEHLLQTTSAVRLLGAQTILTGVGAGVARTVVRLGVNISAMQTCARLSEGIALALRIVGKEIAPLRRRHHVGG